MTPFQFLILVLFVRTLLEVWYQGDITVELKARVEALAAIVPIRTWRRLPYNLLTLYGGIFEAMLCEFCLPHHLGAVFGVGGLLIFHPPATLYAFFLTVLQGIAYGWAAGYINWAVDTLGPPDIAFSRPRSNLETDDEPSEPGPTQPADTPAVPRTSETAGPDGPHDAPGDRPGT